MNIFSGIFYDTEGLDVCSMYGRGLEGCLGVNGNLISSDGERSETVVVEENVRATTGIPWRK